MRFCEGVISDYFFHIPSFFNPLLGFLALGTIDAKEITDKYQSNMLSQMALVGAGKWFQILVSVDALLGVPSLSRFTFRFCMWRPVCLLTVPSLLGMHSHQPILHSVLSGSVLTSYVGVGGLLRRMAVDRCMPRILMQRNFRLVVSRVLLSCQWQHLGCFRVCG